MATVGFVVHPARPEAGRSAAQAIRWLEARGHAGHVLEPDDRDATARHHLDLVASLGGDGTMLRSVGLASVTGTPVLGVNFGTLGYLTTVEPDGITDALERFLADAYTLESRMTLDVAVVGAGVPERRHRVLNDVVLARPGGGHTVRVAVALHGAPFLSYAADAVIIATPTGSTAYNLSARGPIASPLTRVQILTPVAPHSLFDRSVVLDADEEVGVAPVAGTVADLVVDGYGTGTVEPGQRVVSRGGRHDVHLVTFEDHPFEAVLQRKFNLAAE